MDWNFDMDAAPDGPVLLFTYSGIITTAYRHGGKWWPSFGYHALDMPPWAWQEQPAPPHPLPPLSEEG